MNIVIGIIIVAFSLMIIIDIVWNSIKSRKKTTSSTTCSSTTYSPELIEYWKTLPPKPPYVPDYSVQNVAQLIEYLQTLPKETKLMGTDNYGDSWQFDLNFLSIKTATSEYDTANLLDGKVGDKYIQL